MSSTHIGQKIISEGSVLLCVARPQPVCLVRVCVDVLALVEEPAGEQGWHLRVAGLARQKK